MIVAHAGGVDSVLVPSLGPVLAKCLISRRCDCGPMPAVLATAAGPSYFFRPAGCGPLSGQTVLATWDVATYLHFQ